MALGIPVNMVVLTIVGMAGLGAMLAIIDNSESILPGTIHADVKSSNLIILSEFNDTDIIDISVEVFDSKEGEHMSKASVLLSGLGATAINVTDENSHTILRFRKADFNMKSGEGYLRLVVKAKGFQEYSNDYAVKIAR